MMVRKVQATKDEIDAYLKEAKSRIRSAELLLDAGQYNDAVSRAYYAFFDAARAALLTKNFMVKTHGGVLVLFSKYFIKTNLMPVKFFRYLGRAFQARQEADYEIKKNFSKEAVEAAIISAKEFVSEIEKLISK